jgi:hypothetical protein
MGDHGDYWRDVGPVLDGIAQDKKAHNREGSPALLTAAGIAFDVRNNGAHLIVSHNGLVVDFWPGTGKWIPRPSGRPGRGVRPLIAFLKRKP